MSDDVTSDERPLPYYAGDVRIDGVADTFLMQLLDEPAPSGFEAPAAQLVAGYASTWADDVRVDDIGNVHVTVNRGASGPRVMFTGHIDEIGLIVTKVADHGLVRVGPIGGWDLSIPAGQRVRVLTENGVIVGTIGRLPPHQLADRTKAPTLKDIWLDIGAATKDEAAALVRVGDPIVLDTAPHRFANRRIMSRSADDRIGAFIALQAARRCAGADVEVVALCATREEIGCIGVLPGTNAVAPDEAYAIDVATTSDVPGEDDYDIHVGKGPVVAIGSTTSARLNRAVVDVAHAAGIDIQLEGTGRYTGTDGDNVVRAARGVPVSVISVPTRYLHSPGELFALEDAEALIDLLVRMATRERG